jgi:hypothetical protein
MSPECIRSMFLCMLAERLVSWITGEASTLSRELPEDSNQFRFLRAACVLATEH